MEMDLENEDSDSELPLMNAKENLWAYIKGYFVEQLFWTSRDW